MAYDGTSRIIVEYQGNIAEYRGISLNIIEYNGISWNIMEYLEISWNILGLTIDPKSSGPQIKAEAQKLLHASFTHLVVRDAITFEEKCWVEIVEYHCISWNIVNIVEYRGISWNTNGISWNLVNTKGI